MKIAVDFDGTIADTLPVSFEAFRYVFNKYDQRSLTDEEIIQLFGPIEDVIIRNHLRNKEKVERFLNNFQTVRQKLKTIEEKDLFMKLINVKGMGPKVASGVFATGSIAGIIDAINKENILYLTKFPKIGEKLAKQIIYPTYFFAICYTSY